ncbi:hypothetical protein VYU27_008386 [Nannochloropsis oceanica]
MHRISELELWSLNSSLSTMLDHVSSDPGSITTSFEIYSTAGGFPMCNWAAKDSASASASNVICKATESSSYPVT